jgi:hypothetical protein
MSDKKQEMLNEFKLRRLIRKAIQIKEIKRKRAEADQLLEENKLRTVIRYLVQEASVDADANPAPYGSTALDALADAFNQILPVLQSGLRKLKRPEERRSYRAHVLQKFKSLFDGFEGLDTGSIVGEGPVNEQEEDIDKVTISIDDDARVMPSDGKEDERFKEEPKPKLEPDDEDLENLVISTEDPTGARRAFATINNSNIATVLADTRKLLVRPEDKQEFKDYALYNIDLWLLTYEKDIADENGEPPAFDKVVTPKPEGAQIQGAAQDFDAESGQEEEIDTQFDVPELKGDEGEEEGLMEEDLETIFME